MPATATSPKVVVFAAKKGGTGKTTLAHNVGAELARSGRHAVLVDLDAQANLTQRILGAARGAGERHVGDLLIDDGLNDADTGLTLDDGLDPATVRRHLDDLAVDVPTEPGGLRLLPAGAQLVDTDQQLAGLGGRDAVYDHVAAPLALAPSPDFVLLDTGNAANVLTQSAVLASDLVVAPARLEMDAIRGVEALVREVVRPARRLRRRDGREGPNVVIVPTFTNPRTNAYATGREYLEQFVGTGISIAEHEVPNSVNFANAGYLMKPLVEYRPGSVHASRLRGLTDEIVSHLTS